MSNTKSKIEYYKKMLSILGSLSNLFSESKVPYLHSRITENLFCKAFDARNLSRDDVSVDAVINKEGIGIKTFKDPSGKSFQKVAEFNRDLNLFKDLNPREKAEKISQLRNKRIRVTKRICKIKETNYHCIIRRDALIGFYKCSMDEIDISELKDIKKTKSSIFFSDSKNDYKFDISKNTLSQKFLTPNLFDKISVKVIQNPFELIEEKFSDISEIYFQSPASKQFVILPLYSRDKGKKIVYEKSGLNQWNAGGRKRSLGEVYVPIPSLIHKRFPGFFPPKDKQFTLLLPNGNILRAKICQENSKALMSNPNDALGKWLLRDVLHLKEGELLTYEKLQEIDLDSVMIQKKDDGNYSIDFKQSGTYERFLEKSK